MTRLERIYRRYRRAHYRHYFTTLGYCAISLFWMRGWERAYHKECGYGGDFYQWYVTKDD